MPDMQSHWDKVYGGKDLSQVSWHQASPEPSLAALARHVPEPVPLIDIGGGASGLAAALHGQGWRDLTVLDISQAALQAARASIGAAADQVHWLAADITGWQPGRRYGVWHDRAVFHFLTGADQRAGYLRALTAGTGPGALAVIATFSPDGPDRCSGLPVRQYSAEGLAKELGPGFRLLESWREDHRTPGGAVQNFTWTVFQRV